MLQSYPILKVILEDRRDQNLFQRLVDTEIRVGDYDASKEPSDANTLCFHKSSIPTSQTVEYPCSERLNGRYIVARKTSPGSWHINEVRIFTDFYVSKKY